MCKPKKESRALQGAAAGAGNAHVYGAGRGAGRLLPTQHVKKIAKSLKETIQTRQKSAFWGKEGDAAEPCLLLGGATRYHQADIHRPETGS